MKVIKYIITVAIVGICFCFRSELYQSYLLSFTSQFWFFGASDAGAGGSRELLYNTINGVTQDYDSFVFAVERDHTSSDYTVINIYGTPEALAYLEENCCIEEGVRSSLFSGQTEINFFDFSEILDHPDIERYYFGGDQDTVYSIKNSVNSVMATSYIHKEDDSGNEYLIYAVWGISLALLVFLNFMDIQLQKKKIFLRISMGGSVRKIVICRAISGIVINAVIFAAVHELLKRFIYTDYRINIVYPVYGLFLAASAAVNLLFFKYEYKEIIYGANLNERLLSNAYVIKALIMIMLIISVSVNSILISQNLRYFRMYDSLEFTKELYSTDIVNEETGNLTNEEKLGIFYSEYIAGNVYINSSSASLEDGEPILVMNENAIRETSLCCEEILESSKDFVVCIPGSRQDEIDQETIEFALSSTYYLFPTEEYDYEVCVYDTADIIYFDIRSEVGLDYGFEEIEDPVIVYCNVSPETIETLSYDEEESVGLGILGDNIMFTKAGLEDISSGDAGEYDVESYSSLYDICVRYRTTFLRIIVISLVISLFLIFLSLFMVSLIVRLEYMINSKKIALGKIFGTSLPGRNKAIMITNVFTVVIGVITGILLSVTIGYGSIATVMIVGVAVAGADTLILLINMALTERKNITQILKGGCL